MKLKKITKKMQTISLKIIYFMQLMLSRYQTRANYMWLMVVQWMWFKFEGIYDHGFGK